MFLASPEKTAGHEEMYRDVTREDGIRYTRWAVIRNTYPELKSTTIATWQSWFNEDYFGRINWGTPIKHHLQFDDVDCEVLFLALDKERDIKKLLSLEITGIYFNELRELPRTIVNRALERCGRYPDERLGGPSFYGVIADTNPPDDDHWIYNVFEVERPKGVKLYRQPPGLIKEDNHWITNPKAENIENLPQDYYLNMVNVNSPEELKVYALGEYGTTKAGKPVYSQYNDRLHYTDSPIEILDDEIVMGMDFGLTPACVFQQMTKRGQLRTIHELIGEDIDVRSFANDVIKPFIQKHYRGLPFKGFGDPSGTARKDTDASNCIHIVRQPAYP